MATNYNASIGYDEPGMPYNGQTATPSGTGGMGAGGAMLYERDRDRYVLRVAQRRRDDADVLALVVSCIDLL